ncbi:hypothetical protein U1Q18_037540, partial [Sarracenia purpurea var. burkii]
MSLSPHGTFGMPRTNLDPAKPTHAFSRSADVRDDGSVIPFGSLTGLISQPIISFDLQLGPNSGWICKQDPHGCRSPESLLERFVFSSSFGSPMGYQWCPRRTGATPEGRVDPILLRLVPGLKLLYICALTLRSKITAWLNIVIKLLSRVRQIASPSVGIVNLLIGTGDPTNLGVVAPIGVTGREPELRAESPIYGQSAEL